jgi:caa(3)-type oxidase subunit IV
MVERCRGRSVFQEIWLKPLLTWACLCVLLAATCTLAYVPMGSGNLPVSLVIAALKAGLVGAVFMRLAEDTPLHRLAASTGPIWIFIMFVLMGADYFTR